MVIYRLANREYTVFNHYQLPLFYELQHRMEAAVVLAKVPMKNSYNLKGLKKRAQWKTIVRCSYEHFEHLSIPLGLINVPVSFQSVMNHIFKGSLHRGVVVHMNNILIY